MQVRKMKLHLGLLRQRKEVSFAPSFDPPPLTLLAAPDPENHERAEIRAIVPEIRQRFRITLVHILRAPLHFSTAWEGGKNAHRKRQFTLEFRVGEHAEVINMLISSDENNL